MPDHAQAHFELGLLELDNFHNLEESCQLVAAYIDERCANVQLRNVGVHIWTTAGPPFARYLRRSSSFLLAGGQIAQPVPTSRMYTNDLIDEINSFDQNAIKAEAVALAK